MSETLWLSLNRTHSSDVCTLGILTFLHRPAYMPLYTLERPWLDNQPFISCVPTGAYDLVFHSTPKYPSTWALVGETVSHLPHHAKQRSTVLFHAGNFVHHSTGCILLGAGVDWKEQRTYHSRYAMDCFRSWLTGDASFRLRITDR